jgi:hypothetical protein
MTREETAKPAVVPICPRRTALTCIARGLGVAMPDESDRAAVLTDWHEGWPDHLHLTLSASVLRHRPQ